MRADVNLSVREAGSRALGTRTEMKNLNSFKAIAHAIDGERERQIELLEEGKEVLQETRRWDDNKESSRAMRSKEDAKDYRYFPDPDLPPVVISDEWLERLRKEQPELQEEKAARYEKEYGLSEYDARVLTQSRKLARIFEETAKGCGQPKKAANWMMGEVLRRMKDQNLEPEQVRFSPKHLAELIRMTEEGRVSAGTAKKVFREIFDRDVDPAEYVKEHSLEVLADEEGLRKMVRETLEENPGSVREYQEGKEKVLGFFVGQVMKKSRGQADPGLVNRILAQELRKQS